MKIGLKLWSTNNNYFEEALRLYGKGVYDYIELFAVPRSYESSIAIWKEANNKQGIPFVIHAPHYSSGMNLSEKESEGGNKALAGEAFAFADALSSDIIIFHSGVGGREEETARQLKTIVDKRVVIENTPYYTIDGSQVCNGHSPEQIKMIIEKSGAGFCLDIGHAICAANSKKADPDAYIKAFLSLRPRIFHFSDGRSNGEKDQHKHFGDGDYEISRILKMIPSDPMITIETVKDDQNSLDDYCRDVENFRKYI